MTTDVLIIKSTTLTGGQVARAGEFHSVTDSELVVFLLQKQAVKTDEKFNVEDWEFISPDQMINKKVARSKLNKPRATFRPSLKFEEKSPNNRMIESRELSNRK